MNPPRHGEGDRSPKASGGGGGGSLRKPSVYTARRLRREMSLPEVLLWQELRKRPGGLKFRRQHPVGPYVADFFCAEAALAIEVDGAVHEGAAAAARDRSREAEFMRQGVHTLRVPAGEVLRDLRSVLLHIVERAGSPLHHAAHGPPPRAGEE